MSNPWAGIPSIRGFLLALLDPLPVCLLLCRLSIPGGPRESPLSSSEIDTPKLLVEDFLLTVLSGGRKNAAGGRAIGVPPTAGTPMITAESRDSDLA